MQVDRYANQRDEWEFHLGQEARDALVSFLGSGGGLLGVHSASICFDDWPEWGKILGGRWDWDRSSHPPVGPAAIRVVGDDEVISGLGDFETFDEVYGFLDVQPDVVALMVSSHGGAEHPVMWRHYYKTSRVAYVALGHDLRAYSAPPLGSALRRTARWIVGMDSAQ
jgi:hypothetical protein